jgi:hypothetical protein
VATHYNETRHEPTPRGKGASEGCRPKLPRWPFSVLDLGPHSMPLGTSPPFLQEGIQKAPLAGATGGRLRASVYSSGAGAPVKECAWCRVRHAQAASKAFYGSKTHHTITLCPSVGTYVDRVRSAEVLCGPRFSECFSFPITSDHLPTLVTCLPCRPQFYSHLLDNARYWHISPCVR